MSSYPKDWKGKKEEEKAISFGLRLFENLKMLGLFFDMSVCIRSGQNKLQNRLPLGIDNPLRCIWVAWGEERQVMRDTSHPNEMMFAKMAEFKHPFWVNRDTRPRWMGI